MEVAALTESTPGAALNVIWSSFVSDWRNAPGVTIGACALARYRKRRWRHSGHHRWRSDRGRRHRTRQLCEGSSPMPDSGVKRQPIRLLHLSDVHFGAEDIEALKAVEDFASHIKPDAVIIAGDITQSGRRREFEAGARLVRQARRPADRRAGQSRHAGVPPACPHACALQPLCTLHGGARRRRPACRAWRRSCADFRDQYGPRHSGPHQLGRRRHQPRTISKRRSIALRAGRKAHGAC